MNDVIRKEFEENGYVVLRGFVAGAELEQLQRSLNRFIRDVVPTMPAEMKYYDDKQRAETLKQLQSLHQYDDYFAGLFLRGRFPELAADLLQDQAEPSNIQYFNKSPGVGQPTPPHQDGYYFMLDPCEALTMWLALDVVDEENGCVRYVRGSHRREMRPHGRTKTLGFSQGIIDFPSSDDLLDERPIPALPGDLLVHHALTIHRADGNYSQVRSRRALGLTYFAARAKEDKTAQERYQARLAEEMRSAGAI